jgi:hypothetical protein
METVDIIFQGICSNVIIVFDFVNAMVFAFLFEFGLWKLLTGELHPIPKSRVMLEILKLLLNLFYLNGMTACEWAFINYFIL